MKKSFFIFIFILFISLITACSNGACGSGSGGNTPPITITTGQFALAGFEATAIDSEDVNESVTAVMYLTVVNQNYQNFMIYLPSQETFSYGNGSFIVESPIWSGSTTGTCLTAKYRGIRRDLNDEDPLTMYKDETGTLVFNDCNLNSESLLSATMVMTDNNSNSYKYILSGFVSPVFNIESIDASNALYTGTPAPIMLIKMLMSFDSESDLIPVEFLSDVPFGNQDTLSKLITLLQNTESSFNYSAPVSGQSAVFGTVSGDISMDVLINFSNFILQMNNILGTINLSDFPQSASSNHIPQAGGESATINIAGTGDGSVNNVFNPRGEVNGNYIMSVGINTSETTSISAQSEVDLFGAYASMFPNYRESFVVSYANYTESLGKLFIFDPSDKAHLVLEMTPEYPNISTFYTMNIKISTGLTITEDDIIPQNEDIKCSIGSNNTIVCDFYQNANGRGTKVDLYVGQVTHQEGFVYPINVTTTQNANITNAQTRIRFVTPDNPTTESKAFAYISLPNAASPGNTRLNICNVQTNTLAIESCAVANGFESENGVSTISIDSTNNRAYIAISKTESGTIRSCALNNESGSLSDCIDTNFNKEVVSAQLNTQTSPNQLYVNTNWGSRKHLYACQINASTGEVSNCQSESETLGAIPRDYSYTINNDQVYYLRGADGSPQTFSHGTWNGTTFTNVESYSSVTSQFGRFNVLANKNGIVYATSGALDPTIYTFNGNTGEYIDSTGMNMSEAGNTGTVIQNVHYLFYQNDHLFMITQEVYDGASYIAYCNINVNNTINSNSCTNILNVGVLTGEVNYPAQGIGFYNLPQ